MALDTLFLWWDNQLNEDNEVNLDNQAITIEDANKLSETELIKFADKFLESKTLGEMRIEREQGETSIHFLFSVIVERLENFSKDLLGKSGVFDYFKTFNKNVADNYLKAYMSSIKLEQAMEPLKKQMEDIREAQKGALNENIFVQFNIHTEIPIYESPINITNEKLSYILNNLEDNGQVMLASSEFLKDMSSLNLSLSKDHKIEFKHTIKINWLIVLIASLSLIFSFMTYKATIDKSSDNHMMEIINELKEINKGMKDYQGELINGLDKISNNNDSKNDNINSKSSKYKKRK